MRQPREFKTEHRARFSQIDAMKVLNNEHYLSYFMEHRTNELRDKLGWDIRTILKLPILFVIKEVLIKYKRPVYGDTPFTITSRVTEINGADIEVSCEMLSGSEITHSTCKMIVTAVDPRTMKSTDWPEDIQSLFYEELSQ